MIYLKATDKETLDQALVDAGWSNTNSEEEIVFEYYTHSHSLDVIGAIHVETGNTLTAEGLDGETIEYPEMVAVEGYHANLLLHGEDLPASLELFVIEAPSTPHRKFA